ncbi:glycs in 277 species: Archae - 0, partial [Striga asiatica]
MALVGNLERSWCIIGLPMLGFRPSGLKHGGPLLIMSLLSSLRMIWRFLKAVILNYYYNASSFIPSIFGASLQRPRFVPGKHGNKMHLDGEARIFLYQLVGTWGQLLFPKPWKEFRLWYDIHKAKGMRPFLDGMVTTGWYKKLGDKIWTPWFIKFVHSRGYFNIYTNFLHEKALSISHRDAGVNYGKTAGPDSYLLDESSIDFNLVELYPLNSLKWYDFCFREVLRNRIVKSSNDYESIIPTVQKSNSIILLSVYRKPEMIIKNILCHFEKLNIQNYLLIGPTSDFQFSSRCKRLRHMLPKKSLELGYDTWLLDASTIPISGDSFLDSFDRSSDFYLGKSTRLLFFRGSSSASKIWDENFLYDIASLVDPLIKDSVSHDSIIFHATEKILEKQKVKVSSVDDMQLAFDISAVHANQTLVRMKNKFVFWSSEEELDKVRRKLTELDMWVVDSDFSCIRNLVVLFIFFGIDKHGTLNNVLNESASIVH